MKIAIATDKGALSAHFGHCEGFTMYEVEGNKILNTTFIKNPGHRPGFLPVFLKENGVNVIIAGGMGSAAQQLFVENGIDVIVGARGNCDEVIKAYMDGSLEYTGEICKEHNH